MRLRPLLSGVAVAAALVAVMFMGAADSAHAATTFTPALAVSVEDPTPGASSNFTSNLDIIEGDVNFAAFIAYIPPEWGVVKGEEIPIGADVGQLDAQSVLGLANGACNTQLPVHFDMQNGSLDNSDTVEFNDSDDSGTADYADDLDGNGFFDAVDKYPVWLNRIFTNDSTEDPNDILQPIRRSIGITPVAGIPIILQFLIFAPGTVIDPLIPAEPEQGFPSVTVLQSIGDTSAVPEPSIINDFCTPLATINLSIGEEGADKFFVNPGDGTYTFGTFALGQRDADGDSYENSLDTCALVANVGNPRVTGDGDIDSDGLDAACDPNDSAAGGTNSDEDADGYQNRQDNCPLDKNGEEEDNQKDDDLDTIGNACDPDPQEADAQGTYTVAIPSADVVIGTGNGGQPGAAVTAAQCPICYDPSVEASPTTKATLPASEEPGDDTATPTTGPGGPSATPVPPDDDDGGSSSVIFIVLGVAAAVIVVGGGAALLMRRRNA